MQTDNLRIFADSVELDYWDIDSMDIYRVSYLMTIILRKIEFNFLELYETFKSNIFSSYMVNRPHR